MQLAIDAVKEGKSILDSANRFGVPRSTLQYKLYQLAQDSGFKKTYSDEQEAALYKYIVQMENRLMGYTSLELRRLAYDFAVKLDIKHNFNNVKQPAGKDWLQKFMTKFKLSFRKAQHTSKARANSFNSKNVKEFYDILQDLMIKYNFEPQNIYNIDETGFSVVPKCASRVVARRGRKQVGGITSAERGQTVTAEICISASGKFMPPMLIFPRVKYNPEYLVGAPAGAWAEFHQSGWINEEIFTKWFVTFIEFSKPTKDKPVLLLLDGHASHIKNLKLIDLANQNYVIIQCFPPHCTHRLQPLDVDFMKPLSQRYTEEVNELQRNEPMTMKLMFSVFGKAFLKAAKFDTAVNAFKKTGICPLNPSVFTEADFATNSVIDQIILKDILNKDEVQAYYNEIHRMENSRVSLNSGVVTNNNSVNSSQCLSTESNEIKIPMEIVAQAELLISVLSRSFVSLKNTFSPISAISISSNSKANVGPLLPNSSESPVPLSSELFLRKSTPDNVLGNNSILQNSVEFIDTPSAAENCDISGDFKVNENVEINANQKKIRAGKTAMITSEEYKNELIAQKNSTRKKEPAEKKEQ